MDDTLLSESIIIEGEEEESIEDNNEIQSDLNSTQVSKQVNDLVPLTTGCDNIENPNSVNSSASPNSTTAASTPNSDSTVQVVLKPKKSGHSKKKRVADMK
jgi:hypothetical protein